MTRERFNISKPPFVRVDSCAGDLVVRGWPEPALELKGDYQLHDSDKGFLVTSQGDLHLYLPEEALLSIGKVSGNLIIRDAIGTCSCEYVQGDVVATRSGDTELGTVHGDLVIKSLIGILSAAEVNGDVVIRGAKDIALAEVHGDLSVRLVEGDVTIEAVNGDSDVRTIHGNVTIERSFRDVNLNNVRGLVNISGVMGDIRLRGGLPDGHHLLEARGDIVVRWPGGLPLDLRASATKIDNRLSLEDIAEKKGEVAGHIGQGGAELTLVSEGRVILRESELEHDKSKYHGGDMEFNFEFDSIAARIEAEVNSHISRVMDDLEAKFGGDFGRRYSEKAARKAEKVAERTRKRTDYSRQASGFDFTAEPSSTSKKAVSIQEQMEILKMVENGKISPEEAQMLLEALEA